MRKLLSLFLILGACGLVALFASGPVEKILQDRATAKAEEQAKILKLQVIEVGTNAYVITSRAVFLHQVQDAFREKMQELTAGRDVEDLRVTISESGYISSATIRLKPKA